MLSTYEKEIIEAVLQHFKYSLKNSAAFLQLPMSTLHQKIKNHTEVAE
jgi:DNA-binding NtrC family response regulator